ncbi:MAG TPA: NUDIX domain-containing protein [Candidatus Saccharimonadales bacterium]|nr:NUDIX domain-containing protein [Candidatus Saccharimonadales bacterium]
MTLKYPAGGFATSNSSAYVLFRNGSLLAFVKRAKTGWMDNHYGLPSGRVDEGESFTQAAIREAKEEVGVMIQAEDLVPVLTWQRHYTDGDWVDVIFEALKWEGELINAEPHLHSEVTWLDSANLPDNVIPEIKFALDKIAAGKTYAEYGWN